MTAVGEVQKGTELNGIYRIDEKIAIGGMGEVYRGHNIQTNDPVAIKIVLPEFARDETILAMFRKEASVLNHLSHEAIVRYHVFSIDAGIARPYLAMEFVDGESLADRAVRQPFSVDETILLTRHLASGLQTAHNAGVIHRDLSPDNIIIKQGEVSRAKIIDFGIAKSAQVGGGTLLGGKFAGKYNFVSPEQLGLFGGEVTPKSDIYSLGLVLVAALRGAPLDMSGSQVDVIEKRRKIPDLDDVDAQLRPLLTAMLQPDPQHRPASMAEIVDWLVALKPPSTAPSVMPVFQQPPYSLSVPPERSSVTAIAETPASGPDRISAPASEEDIPGVAPAAFKQASSPPDTGMPQGSGDDKTHIQPAAPVSAPAPVSPPAPSVAPAPRRSGGEAAKRKGPAAAGRPEKKSGRSGLLLLLLVIVVCAGAAAAYFHFAGGGSEQVAEVDPQPKLVPSETTGPAAPVKLTPRESPVTDPSPEQPEPQPVTDPESPEKVPPETLAKQDPPEVVVNRAATLMETVDNFDGGRCFHASASDVGGNSLVIEGFGLTRAPFVKLEQAIRDAHGVEPQIGMRQIAENQCAIVDFLNGMRPLEKSRPVLDLSNDWIKSGDSLRGGVSRIGDTVVSIFLIDNQGVVYNLGPHLKRVGDKAEFNIKLVELAPQDPLPQLILTVASSKPIPLLQVSDTVLAKSFFPAVLREIKNGDAEVGTAVKFFKLGG